ncbi:hypothetical protein KFK09_005693 [Dendrobium nobile]|uniref:DUF4283 domain-containing protein n=1 Tax=Dendrobium nobile TaxID=94219 RepID=A0A8T3BZV6_DENNO|nr:hypothetical protein KFK09_005693 [Dendrobium nobile]
MGSSSSPSDFPPLSQKLGGDVRPSPKIWTHVFAPDVTAPNSFTFSHHPSEPEVIPFTGDSLNKGGQDWGFCLVGYSIGRRPFYEALSGAIKKTWTLIGSVQLLSLNDGFFLFRFSCREDYDLVWSRGVWFLLGKPFVFQKWHPKFVPKREDFSSVPIWVKIHDLPLACWNSEGISRIASKIGIPVAADKLTELKTRLTYARVCVLVDNQATYPEVIRVSLDGDEVTLKVQYEWRPFPYEHCKSLMHFSPSCPSKPHAEENANHKNMENIRGRSSSRQPRFRAKSKLLVTPQEEIVEKADLLVPNITSLSSKPAEIITNGIGQPLHYQPHSPVLNKSPHKSSSPVAGNSSHASGKELNSGIPNLNSPNEATSFTSSSQKTKSPVIPKGINSPNSFDALTIEEEDQSQQEDEVEVREDKEDKVLNDLSKNQGKIKLVSGTGTSKKTARGKQVKKTPPNKKH